MAGGRSAAMIQNQHYPRALYNATSPNLLKYTVVPESIYSDMACIIERKTVRISRAALLNLMHLTVVCCLLLSHPTTTAVSFQPRFSRQWGRPVPFRGQSSLSAESILILRGGGEAKKEEEQESSDEEEPSAEESTTTAATSMEPVNVHFKTNVGNKLLDHSMDIASSRTKDVAALKERLSRQLPGKPPVGQIRLTQHGKVLKDEFILNELIDDEDDEDDDEADEDGECKTSISLVLDMVPPVDPHFHSHLKEKVDDMTTSELLEAYALNEAAIWLSSKFWTDKLNERDSAEDEDEDEAATSLHAGDAPQISVQIQQHASVIRSQIEETVTTDKAAALLEDPIPPAQVERERARKPQMRGQRVRPGAASDGSGPSSSTVGLKQTVQHNLNIVS
jgi:hypothetical protein